MKTKVELEKDSRWTRPGKMSKIAFLKGIKQAEEGTFYSVEESISNFEKWLQMRNN
jgi:hypothetical protein